MLTKGLLMIIIGIIGVIASFIFLLITLFKKEKPLKGLPQLVKETEVLHEKTKTAQSTVEETAYLESDQLQQQKSIDSTKLITTYENSESISSRSKAVAHSTKFLNESDKNVVSEAENNTPAASGQVEETKYLS